MKTILFCEDDLLVLEDLVTIENWESHGLRPVTAVNGRQGLERFRQERPAVVITDVKMPLMDGLEMMAVIREENPWVPFIILSSFDDYAYMRQAMQLGASDYIRKTGISGPALLEKIRSLLTRQETLQGELLHRISLRRPGGFSPELQRAVDCIRTNLSDAGLSNQSVALAVGLSEKRLGIRFREETGLTMNEYITRERLELAKQLLDRGAMVYEAAEACGYNSAQYFSSAFKTYTGRSPQDWKNRREE